MLSKNKVIVKHLDAIENLGVMDILCTDKTGTLTEGKIVLEKHLAHCKSCLNELNLQKKMLSALDFAFSEGNNQAEIELPANFAKVVAVTAESGVSGLRRPEERSRAFFLCPGLFLSVIVGLGTEPA